jgi:hypothetical protein
MSGTTVKKCLVGISVLGSLFLTSRISTCQEDPSGRVAKTVSRRHHAKSNSSTSCGLHCGTERWPVKTLADADADKVNFEPLEKSVADLTSLTAPTTSSENSRLSDAEKQTYKVQARLVGFKQEFDPSTRKGDKDFHTVIADLRDPSKTMIVEIPDPACGGVCASPKLGEIQQALQKFVVPFPNSPPAKDFVVVQGNVEVEFTGVGFFDFAHGQTGLARNWVELHPVLAFHFLQSGPFRAKKDPKAQPAKHPQSW